jgi:hypothetical protein
LILKAFCAFSKNKLPLWGGQLYRALPSVSVGATSFSTTTLSMLGLFATLSTNATQHNNTQHWVP